MWDLWLVRALVFVMILMALGNLVGAGLGSANVRQWHWHSFLLWVFLATVTGGLALLL